MSTHWTHLACATAFVIFGTSATASTGTVYDCTINSPGARGWIAPRIIIGIEDTETSAMVMDGVIQNVVEAPVPASVSPRDEKSVRIKWTVENIPVANVKTQETAQYSATLFKDTGRIVVTAVLSYFDNEPRGTGTCTQQRTDLNF